MQYESRLRTRLGDWIESAAVQHLIVALILIATFTMLNLFIAIIVSAMQSMVEEQKTQETSEIGAVVHDENLQLHQAIRDLRDEVRSLRASLQRTDWTP